MELLTARDAERILAFVAEAGALATDEPFTSALLAELGKLVPADFVTYAEQDRVRKCGLVDVHRIDDEGWPPATFREGGEHDYWKVIAGADPVCNYYNSGHFPALKLSDFLTRREFARTEFAKIWFEPAGINHALDLALPSPPWHTKTLMFHRTRGDFTERDRLVLDRLQPHLASLWRGARTRRLLAATLAALETSSEERRRKKHAIIVLSGASRIDFASPLARELLAEYLDAQDRTELPAELARWLELGEATFSRRRGERTLTVERSGNALLLEERRSSLPLTPRETQIMAWVARGMTNQEIARTLWISPGTVRTHLENTYAKLGVRSRTAAAALFLAALDEAVERPHSPELLVDAV
jgi:DNA-binding CsgD family transcriptional regulator